MSVTSMLTSARQAAPTARAWVQLMYYRVFKGRRTLELEGRRYPYLYRHYNTTFINERAIELPVAWKTVQQYPPERVLEIGNVLAHYYPVRHDVVDKYETAPGVINADVVEYAPNKQYDLIVCVSTLEHVGWDEDPREPEKFFRAIDNLKGLLAPGGTLFMTLPIDYNQALDGFLAERRVPFTTVAYAKRISRDNRWREATLSEVQDARYTRRRRNRFGLNVPGTATGLVIGTIVRA